MTPRREETGAALLMVLMLVAVIAVLAAVSLERLKIATRASINMIAIDQARAYGYAAEAVALSRIADLVAIDPTRTTLAGDWNGRTVPFPIDGGIASARVSDGGNCFNLNSVVSRQAQNQTLFARPVAIEQFASLMLTIGVPDSSAKSIAAALADWIDSDSVPVTGGAEDGAYGGAQAGYRTANGLMVDPSEIRVLAGMTPEIYATVRPWVCALPVAELSPINVNTIAPAQAPLIAMLLPNGIDVRTAKRVIDERPANGYANAVSFWNSPAFAGRTPAGEAQGQVQTRTRWFALDLSIALAGSELRETALVDAEEAPARLVRRAYGDPA
ncbi:MAG: type II secretion system minor pseudopilin GspK [Sphingomonadaceae bacterium]